MAAAAAAILAAAAPFAVNAALAANDAVDNGAQGPHVYTTLRAPPLHFVRVIVYNFLHFELPGPGALLHLDAGQPYFDQLIQSHMGFNVGVEVCYNTSNVHGEHRLHYIVIPPIIYSRIPDPPLQLSSDDSRARRWWN